MTRRPPGSRPTIRRIGLLAAAVAVVVTNAAIFGHVAWNRAGGPTARLTVTDRELGLPSYGMAVFEDDEDTGIELYFVVQDAAPEWLDRGKLGELGFDVTVDPEGARKATGRARIHYRNVLPRDAWIVVEHEGEAWVRWLAEQREGIETLRREVAAGEATGNDLERAEGRFAESRVEASRLFAVDAGLDREALRTRYGEPDRFAVVPGTVRLRLDTGTRDEPAHLEGSLELAVHRIQVPLRLRRPTERAIADRDRLWRERNQRRSRTEGNQLDPIPPVLRAEVAFGRLGEPWLLSVEALPVEAATPDPAPDSQPRPSVTDEATEGDGSGEG